MEKNHKSALFSISFRPFFILAALIATMNPMIWVLSYLGRIKLPLVNFSPLFWHGHEMIFGFVGALIAGFILTASANWTSTRPYQGSALVALVLLWLMERFVYFIPMPMDFQLIIMNTFYPALTIMLMLKLNKSPKQKFVFIPILAGLTIAKIIHSYGFIYDHDLFEESARGIATGLTRFIILLIAGRVIPFFTRKRIEGSVIELPNWINPLALVPIGLLIFCNTESMPVYLSAVLLLAAIFTNILRQLMWKPNLSIRVPMLLVLHIGIGFINLGLCLEFLALFYTPASASFAALHLLMAGGLGVVAIGIMTRVTLGHTGRIIKADKLTCLAYLLVIFGAMVRVFIPVFFSEFYIKSLYIASSMWTLGFFIFLLRYLPLLVGARPDGREY